MIDVDEFVDDLWKKWTRAIPEEKINLKWPSLKGVVHWYMRECDRRGLDPQEAVDLEAELDPSLTYAEQKKILESLLTTPLTEPEAGRMYEEVKGEMQRRAREEYPEIFEELEEKIVELEREAVRGKKRLKRIKELKLLLAETERKLEEERLRPPEVAPLKIRILKPFTEGIIDYKVGSVIETRDIDWALDKIEKGFAERVPPEVPVEVPRPPEELSEEQIKKLEDLFRASLSVAGLYPPRYISEFRVEIDAVKFLPYERARDRIEALAGEIIARVPPKVPRVPRVFPRAPPHRRVVPPTEEPLERFPEYKDWIMRKGITWDTYIMYDQFVKMQLRGQYLREKGRPY